MKPLVNRNLLLLSAILLLLMNACKNNSLFTQDDIDMLKLLKAKHITCTKLKELLESKQNGWSNDTGRICAECGTPSYCGISITELKQNMTLYRDNVWSKLSNGSTIGTATAPFDRRKYASTDNLDARFMEVPFDTLMNYLCFVQRRAHEKLNDAVSAVRLYYIQYPGSIGSNLNGNAYAGCHSLAFVPVLQSSGTDYLDSLSSTIYDPAKCRVSTAENHNIICPPMSNCISNTIIATVDQ